MCCSTSLSGSVKRIAIVFAVALSFMISAVNSVYAMDSYLQDTKLSINQTRSSLADLFSYIEQRSEYLFFYADADIKNVKVSVKAENKRVDEILDIALKGTGISYFISGRNINILKKDSGSQQSEKKIAGIVTDGNGDPIIGANVLVKGTTIGSHH